MKIKRYKCLNNKVILQDFEIEKGKVSFILGRNGSGKTLFSRSLSNFAEGNIRNIFSNDFETEIEIEDAENTYAIHLDKSTLDDYIYMAKDEIKIGVNIKPITIKEKELEKILDWKEVKKITDLKNKFNYKQTDLSEFKGKTTLLLAFTKNSNDDVMSLLNEITKPSIQFNEKLIKTAVVFRSLDIKLEDFTFDITKQSIPEMLNYIKKENYEHYSNIINGINIKEILNKQCPICGNIVEENCAAKTHKDIKKIIESIKKSRNEKILYIEQNKWTDNDIIRKLEKHNLSDTEKLSDNELVILFKTSIPELESAILWNEKLQELKDKANTLEKDIINLKSKVKLPAGTLDKLNQKFKNEIFDTYKISFQKTKQDYFDVNIENKEMGKEIVLNRDAVNVLSESQLKRIQITFLFTIVEQVQINKKYNEIVLILDDPMNSLDEYVQIKFAKLIINERPQNITLLILTHSLDSLILLTNKFNWTKKADNKNPNLYILENTDDNKLLTIHSNELNIIRNISKFRLHKLTKYWDEACDKCKWSFVFLFKDYANDLEETLHLDDLEKTKVSDKFAKHFPWQGFKEKYEKMTNIWKDTKSNKPDIDELKIILAELKFESNCKVHSYNLLKKIISNLIKIVIKRCDEPTNKDVVDFHHTPSKYIGYLATKK